MLENTAFVGFICGKRASKHKNIIEKVGLRFSIFGNAQKA